MNIYYCSWKLGLAVWKSEIPLRAWQIWRIWRSQTCEIPLRTASATLRACENPQGVEEITLRPKLHSPQMSPSTLSFARFQDHSKATTGVLTSLQCAIDAPELQLYCKEIARQYNAHAEEIWMDQSGTDVTPMMGDSHPSYKLTICADSVNRDVSVRASVLKRYMVDTQVCWRGWL